jgi:hypothetical protein
MRTSVPFSDEELAQGTVDAKEPSSLRIIAERLKRPFSLCRRDGLKMLWAGFLA